MVPGRGSGTWGNRGLPVCVVESARQVASASVSVRAAGEERLLSELVSLRGLVFPAGQSDGRASRCSGRVALGLGILGHPGDTATCNPSLRSVLPSGTMHQGGHLGRPWGSLGGLWEVFGGPWGVLEALEGWGWGQWGNHAGPSSGAFFLIRPKAKRALQGRSGT